MEDARVRCIHVREKADRIPALNKIENFTREYLILRRIELAVPDPDWATRREIELARDRYARILPAFSSAAPQLRELKDALFQLSSALYKASQSATENTQLQNMIGEQRKKVHSLIQNVELAIQVVTATEFANSDEFYEPQFQEALLALSNAIDQISAFSDEKQRQGEQDAPSNGG